MQLIFENKFRLTNMAEENFVFERNHYIDVAWNK